MPAGHAPVMIGCTSARLICCQIGPLPSSSGITGVREGRRGVSPRAGALPFAAELRAKISSQVHAHIGADEPRRVRGPTQPLMHSLTRVDASFDVVSIRTLELPNRSADERPNMSA